MEPLKEDSQETTSEPSHAEGIIRETESLVDSEAIDKPLARMDSDKEESGPSAVSGTSDKEVRSGSFPQPNTGETDLRGGAGDGMFNAGFEGEVEPSQDTDGDVEKKEELRRMTEEPLTNIIVTNGTLTGRDFHELGQVMEVECVDETGDVSNTKLKIPEGR